MVVANFQDKDKMEQIIDKETAENEVGKWLDFKKVKDVKRESSKDTIESLIEAVQYGQLTLKDDMSWEQKLDFPIPGDEPLTTLTFKPRITVRETHAKTKNVKAADVDGRIAALVAALTGKNTALIISLDSSDYSVSTSIALFFL